MKKLLSLLGLVLFLSVLSFGQNETFKKYPEDVRDSEKNETRQRTVREDKKKSKADMEDVLLESETSLDAKLLSTLDVKKAEVGDQVVFKTTKSIKQNGEVVVPKGTKLIGRITEVKRKTKQDKTSKISMVFESLQNKSLNAPINASIVAIAKVRKNIQTQEVFSKGTGSSSSTSRSSSGGGLLGGLGNTVGGVTNTVGSVTNTVGNTAGGATNTLGSTINGIQISQSVNASISGSSTLSAQNKNIRLQKGTQFQLQLNESVQK